MFRIALKMLVADRAKFTGLLFGIAFTSFLVTFAASYFCGFMTRGFSLISENGAADVWVMDPAVESVEQTINLPISALYRVRKASATRFRWRWAPWRRVSQTVASRLSRSSGWMMRRWPARQRFPAETRASCVRAAP